MLALLLSEGLTTLGADSFVGCDCIEQTALQRQNSKFKPVAQSLAQTRIAPDLVSIQQELPRDVHCLLRNYALTDVTSGDQVQLIPEYGAARDQSPAPSSSPISHLMH